MTTDFSLAWLDQSIAQKSDVDKRDLREALQTLGSEMTDVQAGLTDKASISHNHETASIIDLDDQLADRVRREDGISTRLRLEAPRFALGSITFDSGTLTLDCTDGFDFVVPLAGNVTTIEYQNLGAVADTRVSSTIFFRQGGTARTVAYPSNWLWPGGTSTPVGGANKATAVRLETVDGGETWLVLSVQVYGDNTSVVPSLDGDLAYGGKWYGNAFGGAGAIGNKQIRWNGSSFDIAAAMIPIYKTGSITHITQNNRTDKTGETGYGPGGNTAWIELRKTLTDGKPDMTGGGLLGRTNNYDPADLDQHPKLALQSPAAVTAGTTICMVWRNSTQDAGKYHSANFLVNDKPITPRGGPAWAGCKVWISSSNGASWVEAKGSSKYNESTRGMYSFWGDLFYADGIVHGNPYRFANASDPVYIPLIDGANMVRQRFRMRASVDFVAKAIWLRPFSEDDSPSLTVTLRQGATVMATLAVPAASITKMTSADSVVDKVLGYPRGKPNAGTVAPIQWFRLAFSSPQTLVASTNYEVRLTATAGSKCRTTGTLNARREDDGVYNSLEGFDGSASVTQGEYSTDNGATWQKVTAKNGTGFSYDLPILFEA